MEFVFGTARTNADVTLVREIEHQVFSMEKRLRLRPLQETPAETCFRLLARTHEGVPAGCVTVLESQADCRIFGRYGWLIAGGVGRCARYTRLAVLPGFRGQNLSLRLILEAQRQLVAPKEFRRTWLLLPVDCAEKSLLSALLGFQCAKPVIRAEYGACRILHRDETSITSVSGNRRGWAYLAALAAPGQPAGDTAVTAPRLVVSLAQTYSASPAA